MIETMSEKNPITDTIVYVLAEGDVYVSVCRSLNFHVYGYGKKKKRSHLANKRLVMRAHKMQAALLAKHKPKSKLVELAGCERDDNV